MKKFLLGAAAVLAMAVPGVASAQSTGYVDLGYSSSEGDVAGFDVEGDGWALGGATTFGIGSGLGAQLDGSIGESEDTSVYNVGGHLFTRNDSYLFGGFANFGSVEPDGGGEYDLWTAGLEGQWYASRTTFDWAVAYSEAEDLDATFTGADLGATHFVTDNFSFGGGIGFGNIEVAGFDADTLTYGLGAEYQFASMPISIYGGWNHADISDFDTEADTLSVGVRYNWGGSLLDRNRSGASLARGGGLGRFGGLL